MILWTTPSPFISPSKRISFASIFTNPMAMRLSLMSGEASAGDHEALVVSTIREFGYPIWLTSRKNWSTKSRASWKLSSFICSLKARCWAVSICVKSPAVMMPRISTTTIISSRENPFCRLRIPLFPFMSAPPNQRPNRHREREQDLVRARTFHLRRDCYQLDVARGCLNIPADVVGGLPAGGPTRGVGHVITNWRASASLDWCKVNRTRRQQRRSCSPRRSCYVDRICVSRAVCDGEGGRSSGRSARYFFHRHLRDNRRI